MLSIGDFARLAGLVSVRMLRHYDALGPAPRPAPASTRTRATGPYTTGQLDPGQPARRAQGPRLARGLRTPARRPTCPASSCADSRACAGPRARRADRGRPCAVGAGRATSPDDREGAHHVTVSRPRPLHRAGPTGAAPSCSAAAASPTASRSVRSSVRSSLARSSTQAVGAGHLTPSGPSIGHYTMDGATRWSPPRRTRSDRRSGSPPQASAAGLELADLPAEPRALVTTLRPGRSAPSASSRRQTLSREVEARGLSFAGPVPPRSTTRRRWTRPG